MTPYVNRLSGFYNKKYSEPFTNLNTIGYIEDPYELKLDNIRNDYTKHKSLLLAENKPFVNVVRQRNTFDP